VALIGLSHKQHVAANLESASRPPISAEEWAGLFRES
jgi:hypothetical protein